MNDFDPAPATAPPPLVPAAIGRAFDEARTLLIRHGASLMPVALLFFALPAILLGWAVPNRVAAQEAMAGFVALQLLLLLAALVGQCAIAAFVDGSGRSVGGALVQASRRAPVLLGVVLLALVAMLAALMLISLISLLATGVTPTDTAQVPRSTLALVTLGLIAMSLLILPRLSLAPAMAARTAGGPITLLRVTWAAGRGMALRLVGLFILILVVGSLASAAASTMAGVVALAAGLSPAPFSLGALLVALASGLVQAGFGLVFALVYARIVAQRLGQ